MSRFDKTTPCLGFIYGNRDFFPDPLVTEARADLARLCERVGIRSIQLGEQDSKLGGVETHADARKCAELFKRHADELDGIVVVLPNFGDEKGVAETLKLSGLNVPVLIQAYPDDLKQLNPARRRDAYCGKISVCNNLVQAGIKFTLTSRHVSHPASNDFAADLQNFLGVCRVVKGLRGVRLGAVGARPGAFNTVRYSEKILERHGISVTTVDLSEILAKAGKLDAGAKAVKGKLAEIKAYAPAPGVPAEKLVQMAKMGVALTEWMQANALDATAIQCWTSVQQNFGCNVCTLMSMMSEKLPAQRLRSGCDRRPHHVRHATRRPLTRRAGGLEQQLRRTTTTSASCSIAATGRRVFCPISRSPTRRFWAAPWAWKTPTARWRAARPPRRLPLAA